MKRRLLMGLSVLIFAGAAYGGYWFYQRQDSEQPQAISSGSEQSEVEEKTDQPKETIRIVASGDMLAHDTVNQQAKIGDDYDYTQFFSNIQPIYDTADIVFCNQEGASAGEEFGISGYPSFNAPIAFPRDLEKVGCNVINLANNHVADKGVSGVSATLDAWDNLDPLAVAGANRSAEEQQQVAYFNQDGYTFAFVAFTDLSNNTAIPSHTINYFSDALIQELVGAASQNADYVIVSAHWGIENSSSVSASQESWAQKLSDAGADLIIGTGPHVLQPVDTLQQNDGSETVVWYSIGNMLSTQLKIEELIGGVAIIDLTMNDEALSLKNLQFIPTYMHYEWSADQRAQEDLLARGNLNLYVLQEAAEPLSRSLFETTVESQLSRVTQLLNERIDIEIITPSKLQPL